MCFSIKLGNAMSSIQGKEWLLFMSLFLFFTNLLSAQVNIQQFPRDHQLYQRVLTTNTATIPITGTIAQTEQYTGMLVKVYEPSGLFDQQFTNLSFRRGQANFSFAINLPAELTNFRIELHGIRTSQQVLLKKAEKVVAGDVILINGQSNAEALAAGMTVDYDEFARSYTANFGWNYIQYSYPGRWGARLAKTIITQQGVPVAIFNQAEGGKDIAYFVKRTDNAIQSNYEKLRQRLENAGIDKVTSIAWFQGEGDGWSTSISRYKELFQQLQQAWQADYQPDFTYLFQIRFRSCSHTQAFPFEAQRQVAEELPKVGIVSTTNLGHDGCHFPYENGYREMADNLFYLMRRDIYRINKRDVEAPNISQITQVADRELVLEFDNTSSLAVVGNPWADFRVEGSTVHIINGLIEGNQIRLFLSNAISNIQGISYLAHSGSAADWIYNPNDLGILQFYNYPVNASLLAEASDAERTPVREEEPSTIEETVNLSIDCNAISVQTGSNTLTINGLTAPNVTLQIFDENWSVVYRCIGANCAEGTKVLDNLDAGSYYVKVQLLSLDWQLECFLEETYFVEGEVSTNLDCAPLQISSSDEAIYVNGLKSASVASILVLSMDRTQKYFNCWGASCGEADVMTIPIGTGSYRVIVKRYTAAFEELCYKEQIITVNNLKEEKPIFSKAGFDYNNKQSVVEMEVYPTIARENIYINLYNNVEQVTDIQIWSQYGQIVQSNKIDDYPTTTRIQINHLAKGIYFLNAPLKDGTNLTRKFIIK